MWLTGPVAPRHMGSSQTRARTRVPCIGRQTLNHCATREAPDLTFLKNLFIWFRRVLVTACGTYFPDQGSNPGPLHWEHGVLTTVPLGQSLLFIVFIFISFLFYFYFLKIKLINFLAALGLHCCAWAFLSSCGKRGLLFVAVWWLLLLRSTGSRHTGFSSCSTWAQ